MIGLVVVANLCILAYLIFITTSNFHNFVGLFGGLFLFCFWFHPYPVLTRTKKEVNYRVYIISLLCFSIIATCMISQRLAFNLKKLKKKNVFLLQFSELR